MYTHFNKEHLSCVIYLDNNLKKKELLTFLADILHGSVELNTIIVSWGYIYVEENDDFDLKKMNVAENGFVYYPFMLEIEPKEDTEEELYINNVYKLLDKLRELNMKSVLSSDFS